MIKALNKQNTQKITQGKKKWLIVVWGKP